VNDPVDRLLVERQRSLDAGFSRGMLTSLVGHFVLVGAAVAAPLLFPKPPPLMVADGFAVALPRGGGGDPNAGGQPPPPAVEPKAPDPEPPAPEPPPKVIKPPKEEPKKGLPELDSKKKAAKKPEKPAPSRATGKPEASSKAASGGSSRPGPGTNAGTPGLALGLPPGPGVPDGTDSGGDWYLAGVQQKIWAIWSQQIKSGFVRPIGVTFTILADGSVTDVSVIQPSGATLLDLAAQRAILTAAPFAPLPKEYGTNRKTIQAVFQPTS
jgi:periplasmic protein TonB